MITMTKIKSTKKTAPAQEPAVPVVVCDHQRRTAIALEPEDGIIKFIPLSYEVGLEVVSMDLSEFRRAYPTVMPDYPVERAAVLYAQYALDIGASEEALDVLARFTTLTEKDREMATKAKPAAGDKPAKKTPAAKKAAAPAKTAAAKKAPAEKATKAKAPAAEKTPRVTASSRFRELLVAQAKGENKLSDDQIFAKVQKEFGLDDNKRSYISWYRNDAIRKGLIAKAK